MTYFRQTAAAPIHTLPLLGMSSPATLAALHTPILALSRFPLPLLQLLYSPQTTSAEGGSKRVVRDRLQLYQNALATMGRFGSMGNGAWSE